MEELEITKKLSSWKNIVECIQDSNINAKGSFWAAIQDIESQIEARESYLHRKKLEASK